MKKILLTGFLTLISLNVYAESLPSNILAEHATHVGFAPPEHRGVFKFQILNSGVIRKIDNKNNTTVLARLSKDVVKKISSAIDTIKSAELSKPRTPPCMDAPSQDIQVRQSNGTSITIWRRSGCRDFEPLDQSASSVADIINNLDDAFSQINYLEPLD